MDGVLAVVGLGGCGPSFADAFEIALGPSKDGAPVLEMRPRRAEIAASFARVDLRLDPESFLPREVVLHEVTGDRVRLQFFDLRRGARLDASLFEFNTPRGYSVVP